MLEEVGGGYKKSLLVAVHQNVCGVDRPELNVAPVKPLFGTQGVALLKLESSRRTSSFIGTLVLSLGPAAGESNRSGRHPLKKAHLPL